MAKKLIKKTFADGPLYRRVPSTREAIHDVLRQQLIAEGADPESIMFESKEVPQGSRCCAQVEVTAYGTKVNEERAGEVDLDDSDQQDPE